MAMVGWRLARSRSSLAAQLPLAICGVLAVGIAILGRVEPPIFDAVRANLTDVAEPVLAALYSPVAVAEQWAGGATTFFTTYRENIELRKENAELKKWQDVAMSLDQRLRRYELLLKAVPDPLVPSLAARVIGQSNHPFAKTMILNVGAEQSVRKGQAVLDDRGLIGRIYLTGARTSWVILLGDANSRVPVVIEPSNRRAILAGDNTASPQLQLDLGSAPVKEGDRVLSTADGGLLPPDVAVGTVVRDGNTLRVTLYAKPDATDYVHVLDYDGDLNPPSALNDPPLAPQSVLAPPPRDTAANVSPAAKAQLPSNQPPAGGDPSADEEDR